MGRNLLRSRRRYRTFSTSTFSDSNCRSAVAARGVGFPGQRCPTAGFQSLKEFSTAKYHRAQGCLAACKQKMVPQEGLEPPHPCG
ncbi:protein of unknown function [Hyphomicrobium sp. MC1]|nr:protein of unknown function [Hyphomicrobium sp. MC1]